MQELGQLEDAVASYHRALEIKPGFIDALDNLLLALNYTGHAPSYYLEQARRFGHIVADKAARFSAWQCTAGPERLRVGLVSGDLHKHSVGYFLENLLAHLDPSRIELIAYPTHHKQDELTARIRRYFSAWKPLFGLNDEAAARLDPCRRRACADRPVRPYRPQPPAGVRVEARPGAGKLAGLFRHDRRGGNGLPAGRCRRRARGPAGAIHRIRLVPARHPAVFHRPRGRPCRRTLPAIKNGHITFGCFQNLTKVNDGVLELWGKILAALPDATLRLQCKQFSEPSLAAQLLQRLQRHGIDPARVAIHGSARREDYLAAHAEVDMILDTFPYPGGTTTCEALWMGVPTLTLAGDSLLARQGASLLGAAGLSDWVANSREAYVAKAIALASDLPGLARLRAGLRAQVLTSPLFDAPRFARHFEQALWGMWQRHQEQQGKPA